jgi:hypothetical protein
MDTERKKATMFDDTNEDPAEQASGAKDRAKEKSDEFRMHAELVAVFEGCRKFGAKLIPGLDPEIAREVQRGMGKLEKSKSPDHPVLPETAMADAAALLGLAKSRALSTNDYHIHRRPGEVIIIRWLYGDEAQAFYERIQAHFDAAMSGYRDEQRSEQEWKQDPNTLEYLAALDSIEVKMEERYLRELIKQHRIFVLSTQSADEINIAYLCDYIMGVRASDLVGAKSAPPDEPTEHDLAWFFKLFSLRGMGDGIEERMCFFAFLQKSDDDFGLDE